MTGFGKRIDGPQGRRQAERQKLLLAASVDTIGCSTRASVKDVSTTGAKLLGNDLPEVGREVLLRTAGLTLFGDVAWRTEVACGIRFDEAISAHELAVLRRNGRAIAFLHLSPDEKQAAEDWAGGLAR